MDALKLNILSNLTLACFQQGDYIQAVEYASKVCVGNYRRFVGNHRRFVWVTIEGFCG